MISLGSSEQKGIHCAFVKLACMGRGREEKQSKGGRQSVIRMMSPIARANNLFGF